MEHIFFFKNIKKYNNNKSNKIFNKYKKIS